MLEELWLGKNKITEFKASGSSYSRSTIIIRVTDTSCAGDLESIKPLQPQNPLDSVEPNRKDPGS